MDIKFITAVLSTLMIVESACNNKKNDYTDASAPIEKRVEDLMERMTLEEKVGQMCQWVGIYPTHIGLASTFDPSLVEEICCQTAAEMRATGSQWTFNPNVEVARDPRWGRIGETFGEDTYLVTQMSIASVKGYQGEDFGSPDKVLACAKHFVGDSQPVNGTNGSPTDVSERTVREIFFPPFEAAVQTGVFSFMMAHNELNGIPCHSNEWLMRDILRDEWGFKGFVVSDWMDIEHIYDLHHTATGDKTAFFQSVEAGMDMHMHGPHFYDKIIEWVKEGKLPQKRIDEACKKILYAKFKLGLFENPFTDENKITEKLFTSQHKATALEAARKSIVLLTNDGILPLDKQKYKKVFVTGTNADNQSILGDWALPQPPENVITILEGLRQISSETQFTFLDQGWNIRTLNEDRIRQAESLARHADLNILVIGEHSLRNNWYEKTCGEDCDRSYIALAGLQQHLAETIIKTGKPTIVILVNGRQLGVEWIADHANALVEAWEPGTMGGQAVAEILYGKVNPSGKLPVTVPRHVGQLHMVYNHKPSMYFHPYAIGKSTPLFHFGYGLSYTEYEYSDLKLSTSEIDKQGETEVTVNIRNKGNVAGEEIVQLYIRDLYSSVTRPVKELKDFKRIFLQAGETKTVTFPLPAEKLTFYDKKMNRIVESGDFEIMVGTSSRDEDLQK